MTWMPGQRRQSILNLGIGWRVREPRDNHVPKEGDDDIQRDMDVQLRGEVQSK